MELALFSVLKKLSRELLLYGRLFNTAAVTADAAELVQRLCVTHAVVLARR